MSDNIEEIFVSLGAFGRYQKLVFFAACLFAFAGAPTVVQDPFTTYEENFRCFVPSCDSSTTIYNESFIEYSTPYDDEEEEYESCFLYNSMNGTECEESNFDIEKTVNCSRYVYDQELFTSTIISDFSLVCGRSWLVPVCGSCYMAGNLVGAFVFGLFSDRFGRKACLITCCFLFFSIGIGSAWVPSSYAFYLVLRFLSGVGAVPLFATSFVLAIEFIGADWRAFCGMAIQIPFALGETYTGFMAYFIRDWRWLQTSLIAPTILLLPFYWIMPESVRWLISKGRTDEAIKVIQKAARTNKVEAPVHLLQDTQVAFDGDATELRKQNDEEFLEKNENTKKSITILDIMKYKKTRMRSFILFYCWAVSSMAYYGLSSNIGNLSGNIFVNFILTMLIEIPSYIFAYFTLDRIGRKGTMMFVFILGGVSCIISGLLPEDWSTTIVSLCLIGKFGISAAFGSIYVYTAEIYPTQIRSVCVGLCSVFARFGAVLAPIISGLGDVSRPLPLLIYGFLSLAAGCLYLFLPETLGTTLPQTLEQSEKFSDPSIWYFFCLRKRFKVDNNSDDSEAVENEENINGKL